MLEDGFTVMFQSIRTLGVICVGIFIILIKRGFTLLWLFVVLLTAQDRQKN